MGQIPFVTEQFAIEPAGKRRKGLAVISVAGRELHTKDFTPVIDHEMHLEAVKLSKGRLAGVRDAGEHLVLVDPAIMVDGQGGGVDEGNAVQQPKQAWRYAVTGCVRSPIHWD